VLFVSFPRAQENAPRADKSENLIVNGSFEEGPETEFRERSWVPLDVGSTDLKGWTVTRGQIDYVGSHWQAADGFRSLDLHGSPGFGGIAQTFKTTKGQRYRVTFALAGTPGGKSPVYSVCVRAGGKKEVFSFDTTGKSTAKMGWVTRAWDFEAVADRTTLEFHTLDDEDPNCGPALDDVRVTAINANAAVAGKPEDHPRHANPAVTGRQGDRPYPFRPWQETQAEGLALALLGSCGAEADGGTATAERWEAILKNDSYLHVAYPRPRGMGAGGKEFLASEILLSIDPGKEGARPKYILVRAGARYRAFAKYDADLCAALQEVLRKSMP
jgi:choice-of-anchor C domain-containing protein